MSRFACQVSFQPPMRAHSADIRPTSLPGLTWLDLGDPSPMGDLPRATNMDPRVEPADDGRGADQLHRITLG